MAPSFPARDGRSLVGDDVALGFRGRLEGAAALRRLQGGIDECTANTSVGDAEAGIAIYEDPEACDREGPLVGCNGEFSSSSSSSSAVALR